MRGKQNNITVSDVVAGITPAHAGKTALKAIYWPLIGITPAHAGKTSVDFITTSVDRDHPRACGENWV